MWLRVMYTRVKKADLTMKKAAVGKMQLTDVLDPGNVPLGPVESLGRDDRTLGRADLEPRALGRRATHAMGHV